MHLFNLRFKRQVDDDDGGIGGGGGVEDICRTQQQFISPRAALNDKSQWKYIVNLGDRDPRLRQVIKVDVCSYVFFTTTKYTTICFRDILLYDLYDMIYIFIANKYSMKRER